MEYLDIVDENGEPTGSIVLREKAHKEGIRHRTSHVWIARKNDTSIEILLQKRCMQKDSHPGCYDISSAGHIPAGSDYITSAVRELREELGIETDEEELINIGTRKIFYKDMFHGCEFVDNQVSKVYIAWKDIDISDIVIQRSEIEKVIFMDIDECIKCVTDNLIDNCISLEELNMIKKYISKSKNVCTKSAYK